MPLLTKQFDYVEENLNRFINWASSGVKQGIQYADDVIDENIPGGERYTSNARNLIEGAGNLIQQEVEAADRQVDEPIDHVGDIPHFVFGSYRRGAQNFKERSRQGWASMGVDPRMGDVTGAAAEAIAEIGAGGLSKAVSNITPPGPTLKPAVAGAVPGSAVPTPGVTPKGGPVMEAVTVNNPKVLDTTGRKLGEEIIDNNPELAKHLVKRGTTIQKYENDILRAQEIKKIMPPDSPEWKAANRVIKKRRPKMYSEGSNVKPATPEDQMQYGSLAAPAVLERNKARAQRMQKGIEISEKIHEHHLVTKGGSFAAFRKMEEFIAAGKAELDDLVVMFEYAEKKKAVPGDRRSNISFIDETPHSELHNEVLKPAGDEFTQKQWSKILNEVKTPEDLMNWWVDQVDNNYIPNKQAGMIWQDLDNLVKQIRSE